MQKNMTLEKVFILLPCRSLENLELHCPSREADELLTAWCAGFHPSVLAEIKETPKWEPAETPPANVDHRTLVLIPNKSEAFLPKDWLSGTLQAGARVVYCKGGMAETVPAVLEAVPPERKPESLAEDTVLDFFSVALAHFQVEMITRRMHYMSGLDETRFQSEVVSAAEYAIKGELPTAHEYIRSAFNMLCDARDYYHPTENRLLDLTVVEPGAFGKGFLASLGVPASTHLLVSAETLATLSDESPELLETIKRAVDREERPAVVLGGEYSQRALPLLPPEAILWEFRKGLVSYQELLGRRPRVFARRRFGLTPFLPQLLDKLDFRGVIHATLDDGRFPTESQSKVEWQGFDGTSVNAITRIPLDAGDPATFLSLSESFGDVLDASYSATIVFAHWPGREHAWYGILRRASRYASSLGEFKSVEKYFEDVAYSGHASRHPADAYVSPYLRQEVAAGRRDPISRWIRYYRMRTLLDAILAYDAMECWIRSDPEPRDRAELTARVEAAAERDPEGIREEELLEILAEGAAKTADLLGGESGRDAGRDAGGVLVVSPWSFKGSMPVDISPRAKRLRAAGPVRVVDEAEGRRAAVVDVPGMGFVWVGPGGSSEQPVEKRPSWFSWKKPKPEPRIVEENVLQNEYFQIMIDPATGAIRSLGDFRTRGNRLAQQVALRLPASDPLCVDGDPESRYTIMAADSLRVARNGPVTGEIIAKGRLVNRHGKRLAGFAQTVRVHRGCRVFEIELELDPDYAPIADPWESYYAFRFAWGDATMDVFRCVNGATVSTEAARLESPCFLDFRGEKTRTTLLAGGLPYHRKFGLRKLDSILVVAGETARRFRMGVGIDIEDPLPAALEYLAPEARFARPSQAPSSSAGWLFHLDATNVVATRWEPLRALDDPARVDGVRVRLLETEGRECHLALRAFRDVSAAAKTDYLGTKLETLSIQGDRVTVGLKRHEWAQVELRFRFGVPSPPAAE